MAYAVPADLLKRFDARTVGDLAGDEGKRIVPSALLTDPNVLAVLDDASGEIESALLQGERYTAANLTALTGNSQQYLVRLCCEIAFGLLWRRRPWADDQQRQEAIKRADEHLERLRKGERVFDVVAILDAGLPDVTGATTAELRDLNLLRDRTLHYYPVRTTRGNR